MEEQNREKTQEEIDEEIRKMIEQDDKWIEDLKRENLKNLSINSEVQDG